jgi:SAM-dependent methyltransferase
MTRIFTPVNDEKPTIDKAAVFDFFERRAEKIDVLGPKRVVIYQDQNPDLAERRDAAEKKLLFPLLRLDATSQVLDAGCGTGRWAELIIPACKRYFGVDVSPSLIQIAINAHGDRPNAHFSVCSLDEISLERIDATEHFSHIVSFGVCIYLNDDAVLESLRRLLSVAAPHARILLREPVALQNRLTLCEHFSEDMDQYYNAIYRTEPEFLRMQDSILGAARFSLKSYGDVYGESELNNRAETKQRWYLWER